MQAIREYAVVRDGQVVLNLPSHFSFSEVEVIVLPGYGAEVRNAPSERKNRRPGILKGKADCVIRDDFKLTDGELLGNEIPS